MSNISEIINLVIHANRALVSANTRDEWQSAVAEAKELLTRVEPGIDELDASRQVSEQARLGSALLTVLAEAGQYRHEQYSPRTPEEITRRKMIDEEMLPAMGILRKQVIQTAKKYFHSAAFQPLQADLEQEIFPLLDSMDPDLAPDRFMPFRVIQIGNIAERLFSFRLRTNDTYLVGDSHQAGLLQEIYNRKYLRFGTSGVRGRWKVDFTEVRAKQVAQAICDFLGNREVPSYVGAEDLSGKKVVIGYDSRKNARTVAEWIAQVCLANGFTIDLADRDTPTPALVYYLTDYLDSKEVAGLINCTASHNPPEWQGIKFNPRLGYPAPTNVTDFIAFRCNELQLLNQEARTADLESAEPKGRLRGFDPITAYAEWIQNSGHGNDRIALDFENMRSFFSDKSVVVDEMYGAGRGYLSKLLGEIGIRHTVIHAERNPNIPGLDYANPEEPYIDGLKAAVKQRGAYLGMGTDTDADRFGVVDRDGQYFRPNQILPMLVRYLGIERKIPGRVIATQTGSPLIEVLAGRIPENEQNRPLENTIPLYVRHPFYRLKVGDLSERIQKNTFLVPVGIKYIEEIRRMDREYIIQKNLPSNWRDSILIGGEESSGLTTKGHVTDKDGVWADLLVMDMIAYYARETKGKVACLSDIWKETVSLPGCWRSYGGQEGNASKPNTGRTDIDAILETKEALIDYFLDYTKDGKMTFADMKIVFLGGIRYDIAEMQLMGENGNNKHFLRVRASGTEPINRIYIESSDPAIASELTRKTLGILEEISIQQVKSAGSKWRLIDIISQSHPSDLLLKTVQGLLKKWHWPVEEIVDMLRASLPTLEHRTGKLTQEWIKKLSE